MPERVVEIDYSANEGLTLRFRPHSLEMIPESTRRHMRAANKELLLALRSFVDQAIDRMEPEKKSDRGPRRVTVTDADQEPE